jgi:antitoxin MazE
MPIQTSIRKIGNSKGVILPAAVLKEVGAGDTLMLSIEQGRIVLEATRELRQGWFDHAGALDPSTEDIEWERAALTDDSDWAWD